MSLRMTGPAYGPDDPRSATLVTLDGPAGTGKSSTARAVAERLGYRYLDSGALYRAVTLGLLRAGIDPSDWVSLDAETLEGLGVSVHPRDRTLELRLHGEPIPDDELRTTEVNGLVSTAAKVPAVRDWLWGAQQQAASDGRLVADGRDMGSVVFPQAATKIFLIADPAERARRRLGDQGVADPEAAEVAAEAALLADRDRQDAERNVSPLRRPEGAAVIDTTHLDFEEQVTKVVELARAANPRSD